MLQVSFTSPVSVKNQMFAISFTTVGTHRKEQYNEDQAGNMGPFNIIFYDCRCRRPAVHSIDRDRCG